MVSCGCRCIVCKGNILESHGFVAADGYDDIHHTCKTCGTHFDHSDGETFAKCDVCGFKK